MKKNIVIVLLSITTACSLIFAVYQTAMVKKVRRVAELHIQVAMKARMDAEIQRKLAEVTNQRIKENQDNSKKLLEECQAQLKAVKQVAEEARVKATAAGNETRRQRIIARANAEEARKQMLLAQQHAKQMAQVMRLAEEAKLAAEQELEKLKNKN